MKILINSSIILQSIILSILSIMKLSEQHGRMIEPPARNTAWRFGFRTHIDYNDNELFCGGLTTMWKLNKGKCGLCGDSYSLKSPRPYETGGIYNKQNVIVRNYLVGSIIPINILITANHKGHFQFSLCQRNDPNKLENEDCFKPIKLANGNDRYRLKSSIIGNVTLSLKLPENIQCKYCILRWHWKGGNNWGICPNGKGKIGCGPQETFRNCADIRISDNLSNELNTTTIDSIKTIDSINNTITIDSENNINEIDNNHQDNYFNFKKYLIPNPDNDNKHPKRCVCTCS